ncbi:MAG TPA: hypothetical protein VJT68_05905 [Thermoleophilaceae bacterium]|nr:hypothetical protein [Thermoleophilaceae bacterium]
MLVAALGAPTQAATVTVEGSTLRVLAAPGETNRLTIGASSVTDPSSPVTAGPGCTAEPGGASCLPTTGAFVDAGDGDDAVDTRNGGSDSVWCGRGTDAVIAEVGDFLDLGCEQVDYGPAGAAGRLAWRTGGGRLVEVPGQTWARVDRRILPDVLYFIRRYHVQIWEGFGTVGHEPFGEHPLGLAVDILPGAGGTWDDVSRLARWAEPRQNHPRGPFRWVGWNGDFNHGHPSICKPRLGCAPHLHLSWSHSPTAPRHIARSVRVFQVAP